MDIERPFHYGILQANVSGTDKPMLPEGDYQPFPQEKITPLMRAFRDGSADYKHGMSIERDRQGNLLYLCACASRQTNLTSAAGGYALHAEMRVLRREEFADDRLDELLRFPFANEIDVAFRRKPTRDSRPLPDIDLDPGVLQAIIYGSLGRLLSIIESPVYIALPGQGYDGTDFDETVRRLLKKIYMAMPYALRARAGYITYPNAAAIPDGVTLCFIPDGLVGRYAQGVLFPVAPHDGRDAIDLIMRKEHGRGLRDFAAYLANASGQERRKLFDKFDESKIEKANGAWASFDCRLYGEMFALEHEFNSLGNDDAARKMYIRQFARQNNPTLRDMAWNGVFRDYITEERLCGWLAPAVEAASFSSFAAALMEFKTMEILENLEDEKLWRIWKNAFLDLAKKLSESKGALDWLDEAYMSLLGLFDHEIVTQARGTVEKRHQEFVEDEYDEKEKSIREILGKKNDPLDKRWNLAHLKHLDEFDFKENEPKLKEFLNTQVSIEFNEMCDREDERCEDVLTNIKRFDQKVGNELNAIWVKHQSEQTLEAYFEALWQGEKKKNLNPNWTLDQYLVAWLKFNEEKGGIMS